MNTRRLRKSEATRLKSFRLSEVPENIRRKHGERLVTLAYNHARDDGKRGYALLKDSLAAKQAMLTPSESIYRVSQISWDAMLAEAQAIETRQTRARVRKRASDKRRRRAAVA